MHLCWGVGSLSGSAVHVRSSLCRGRSWPREQFTELRQKYTPRKSHDCDAHRWLSSLPFVFRTTAKASRKIYQIPRRKSIPAEGRKNSLPLRSERSNESNPSGTATFIKIPGRVPRQFGMSKLNGIPETEAGIVKATSEKEITKSARIFIACRAARSRTTVAPRKREDPRSGPRA